MAKNTKKKAKFKESTFIINKGKFKDLLGLVLKHKQSHRTHGGSILNGVKMSVKGNILTLAATDGSSLLELEAELNDIATNEAEATWQGVYLEKIVLKKDYFSTSAGIPGYDVLEITVKEESTLINDGRNQIKYNIPHYMDKYPDYKKLFVEDTQKEGYTKIGLNMALLAKLATSTKHGIPSTISFKNADTPIFVSTNYDGIKSKAIVMPCKVER